LNNANQRPDSRLFRDVLREAIVNSFPIEPGEVIPVQEITERRVHSVGVPG